MRRALGGHGPFYVGTVSQTVRSGNGPYIKIVIQHVNSHSSQLRDTFSLKAGKEISINSVGKEGGKNPSLFLFRLKQSLLFY